MRRGSVVTYADDSRRTSAVLASMERRNTGNSISNRHEFSVHDENYEEPTKGMFISYRSIAFVFVFFLAIFIIAAFAGFYIVSPPEDEVQDALAILANEDDEVSDTYEQSSTIRPLRYSIELTPIADAEKGRVKLKGRVDVFFRQSSGDSVATNQLILNSKHLVIEKYRLRAISSSTRDEKTWSTSTMGITPKPSYNDIKIGRNKTDDTSGAYIMLLENSLRDGNYTLEIEYEATVDENVIFMRNYTKNGNEALLLVSKLKPSNAPRLFPTLGNKAISKANFVLTMIYLSEVKVLSNMPSVNTSHLSNDVVVNEFAESPLISAHNLAFVSGSLDYLGEIATDSSQHSVAHWVSDEHEPLEFYLQDKITPILETYDEMFGVERPTEKLDVAVLPVNLDGFSVPGLIVVKEALFHTAVGSSSLTKTKALINLIGLVGQQWLGGLVDAKNWTDAWYLEGSVIYLQYALLHKIDQSLEASDDFLVDVQLEAMENDGYLISKALSSKVEHNRVEAFDLEDNYRKGACLMSMLHETLGADAFAKGYSSFLQHWSYSIADADDFLHSLTGDAAFNGQSARLNDVFQRWARQPGYPLITIKWDRNNGTVSIRQEKFNFDEYSNEDEDRLDRRLRWWLGLTYVTSEGNWSEPMSIWLEGREEIILKDAGLQSSNNQSWIIFNVNKRGYYRVNYDEEMWEAISSALIAEHTTIPAATRASLIDDALSLARQGNLNYEIALELITYLGTSELDYAPWRAFSRHALQLDFALYKTDTYLHFQSFMQKLVSKLFDEMRPKIDQGSPLAVLAIQLACLFENRKCTSWARNQWDNVVRDSEYTLAKHVRETVYCVGAQRGGREELSYLMQKFTETSDRDEKNRLLSALGCFQRPWILQNILNEILESDKYDDNDIRVILKSYSKNPAAAQSARRFVQEKWTEVVNRFSHSYWTMKSFVEASTSLLYTKHDLDEFNTFRDKNIDSLKLMGHWVALNEMKASSWIFRLNQSFDSLQKWFKNHLSDA